MNFIRKIATMVAVAATFFGAIILYTDWLDWKWLIGSGLVTIAALHIVWKK